MKERKYEGFSLIEILVVVALIVILATITIVAINPMKNFRDTRDAQRSADVNAILSAISQYTTDGKILPTTMTDDIEECTSTWSFGSKIGEGDGNIDLAEILTGDDEEGTDYMVSIPTDPSGGTAEDTGYVICKIGTRIQIAAPRAEGEGKQIAVRR